MRLFKYSYASSELISNNIAFQFAKDHALIHYDSNSVITFIPKNACTSLRASLAIANGFIPSLNYINWIHDNNITMTGSLFDLQRAAYTAIILRCPFERISSAFLDKFVTKQPNSILYFEHLNITDFKRNKFSFKDFLKSLVDNQENLLFDSHWYPQNRFLLYEEYDEYLNLSHSDRINETLKKRCGFEFLSTYSITNNSIKNLTKIKSPESFVNFSHNDIYKMRINGLSPCHSSMFDEEAINLTKEIYKTDIDLYCLKFGDETLLFKNEKFQE
jgi:hypothetical protein